MKALAPVEDVVDPDGVSTTIVDDSDDEYDEVVIPVVVAPVVAPVVEEETIEEVKPKKKIIRKKTDA
jgi:hypothetical protein